MNKKITRLTKEQESKIPEFIQKWINIASTPINKKNAIHAVEDIYSRMGEDKPIIIFGDSPLSCSIMAAMFFNRVIESSQLDSQLDNQLRSQLDSQLYSQLYNQLRSQLDNQLRSQLDSQLDSQLYSQLDNQLYSQLYNQLRSQLDSQLDSQLYSQLDSQLRSQLYNQLRSQLDNQLDSQLDNQLRSQLRSQLYKINNDWYLGIWWLVWCGWYDYGRHIGVKFDKSKYNSFINYNREINFIIPYKNIVYISEKPTEVRWKNGQLHNEKNAAVLYKDGYGLWALNGVRVTKEIVETPADELKPDIILKEKNAEVRREIVRKIGIERICQKLNTETLDEMGDYELLKLKIPDMKTPAIYLKMKNPSIGVFHMEGLPPDIQTCQEAINWRRYQDKNKTWNPSQLT